MEILTATTLDQFIKISLKPQRPTGFRGVSNIDYPLLPGVGRACSGENFYFPVCSELEMFQTFKRKLGEVRKNKSSFECATIAQHHGLPTRLLDWTKNPLVALFFAVSTNKDFDGCVYWLSHYITEIDEEKIDYDLILEKSQFDFIEFETLSPEALYEKICNSMKNIYDEECNIIIPSSITQRIDRQNSFFTIHYNPFEKINNLAMMQIKIPKESKRHLTESLYTIGIDAYSLFPDIDGLAKALKRKFYSD